MEPVPTPGGPIILGLSAAGFRIGETIYPALLMTVTGVARWSPPSLDLMEEATLTAIIDPLPEFLLLGTGRILLRPPAALVRALDAKGIGIEPMDSRAAARNWGVLRGEGRMIAAALYPLDA